MTATPNTSCLKNHSRKDRGMPRVRPLPVTLATATAASMAAMLVVAAPQPAGAAAGDLDGAYGAAGTVNFTPDAGSTLTGTVLGRQTEGVIVAQTSTNPKREAAAAIKVVVRRLNLHGAPDPTFGSDGSTELAVGQPATVKAVTTTPDNKVVVLLSIGDAYSPTPQVGLAKLLPGGQPDPSFGTNGVVIGLGEDGRTPAAVLARPDGSIVVGLGQNGQGDADFSLAHLDAHGVGVERVRAIDLGGYDVLTSLVSDPDGSYYATGYSATAAGQAAVAVRILPDGRKDQSYGAGGVARIAVADQTVTPVGAVVAGSALLLYGTAQSTQSFGAFIGRLTPAGSADSGFGQHGVLPMEGTASLASVSSMVPGGQGQILASVVNEGGGGNGYLTRFDARTGAKDNGYGTGGSLPLASSNYSQLIADGTGTLLAGTNYAATATPLAGELQATVGSDAAAGSTAAHRSAPILQRRLKR